MGTWKDKLRNASNAGSKIMAPSLAMPTDAIRSLVAPTDALRTMGQPVVQNPISQGAIGLVNPLIKDVREVGYNPAALKQTAQDLSSAGIKAQAGDLAGASKNVAGTPPAQSPTAATATDPNITDDPNAGASAGRTPSLGGGGGGPTLVHGSWNPELDPLQASTRAAMGELDEKEVKLRGAQMDVQQAQLDAIKAQEQNKALVIDQHNKAMERQRADEEVQKNLQLSELRGRQDAVENFQYEPDRIFSKSAMFNAAYLVKGVLDGFISGFTGKENEFGKFTDHLLKMDQNRQEAVFDRLKRAEAGQRGRMAEYERLTGSKRAAMLQTEVDKLSALEVMLKKKMSEIDAGTPDTPGAPSTMAGVPGTPGTPGLQSKAQMNFAAAMQELNARKIERMKQIDIMTHVNPHVVGGGGGGSSKTNEDRFVKGLDGKVYEMRGEKEATTIRDKVANALELKRLATELDTARNDPAAYSTLTSKGATTEQLGTKIMLALKKSEELGTLDKGAIEVGQKLAGDPNSLFSRAGQRALTIADLAAKRVNDDIHGGLGEKVDKNYERNPDGSVKRKSTYVGGTANPVVTPKGFKPAGAK